uniref:AB hydrolase-1 domain-containing protein n=1 Tax=Phlebotomus papatasi TaxID=29031 RepID=A0A1B0DK89_PHLPP
MDHSWSISGINHTREIRSEGIVFLQHGLLCSSVDWIVAGPNRSLPYLLAEQGYDVWMGNARGNNYSRRHVSLKPKSRDFWQFSWHEIGIYDLPAMIDYTLNKTGQTSLHYIGYSQGTTAFLVLASMRNDYSKKVSMFQALAPAVFLSNAKSPFIKALAPLANQTKFLLDSMGVHELFPNDTKIVQKVRKSLHRNNAVVQSLLTNILFIIAGFDSQQMDLVSEDFES